VTEASPSPRWSSTDADPYLASEWIEHRDRMDRMLAPFGDQVFDLARLLPGETVLDIGCGTAATAVAAWHLVAPSGRVTGIDISASMLGAAGKRLQDQPGHRIELVHADAQTHPFHPASIDAAISRFGVGHFTDTAAAFTNIAHALRPGGRLVATEWAAPADNEWMTLVEDVARDTLPDTATRASGGGTAHAASFATEASLKAALRSAGLSILTLDRISAGLRLGTDVEDVLAWISHLREGRILDQLDDGRRGTFLAALAARLQRRTRADGIYLNGAAWIIHAHRPG
jgi:ubiquinone/menaquinone biosynthesis C-methylase UbiE